MLIRINCLIPLALSLHLSDYKNKFSIWSFSENAKISNKPFRAERQRSISFDRESSILIHYIARRETSINVRNFCIFLLKNVHLPKCTDWRQFWRVKFNWDRRASKGYHFPQYHPPTKSLSQFSWRIIKFSWDKLFRHLDSWLIYWTVMNSHIGKCLQISQTALFMTPNGGELPLPEPLILQQRNFNCIVVLCANES